MHWASLAAPERNFRTRSGVKAYFRARSDVKVYNRRLKNSRKLKERELFNTAQHPLVLNIRIEQDTLLKQVIS
jgi:hypothetical protein